MVQRVAGRLYAPMSVCQEVERDWEHHRRLNSDIYTVTGWTSFLSRVLLHPFPEQPTERSP